MIRPRNGANRWNSDDKSVKIVAWYYTETAQGFLKYPPKKQLFQNQRRERERRELTGKLVSWLWAADQSEIVKTT